MDENLQVQQEFAARGLNHQQSRLLEQEETHEQKAKGPPLTQRKSKLLLYIFFPTIAASTG